MNPNSRRFQAVDLLLLILTVLPLGAGIVLKILTNTPSEGITLSGARVFFQIPLPLQDLYITEAQINSWLVILTVFFLCLYLTHGLSVEAKTKRQLIVEWAVEKCEGLVDESMGAPFKGFAPFIAAILALSAFSSLSSLLGLYPPTSDLNVSAGWALLVFILITYYKMKCGPIMYLKSFCDPPPMAPLNIISEVATPVSMAFRHYGNILSGVAISVLLAAAFQGLSHLLLGWLPGVLGEIPFLQIGIPAVLSIYFDVFSGCLQAYIFAMLTMMYVSGAFNVDEFEARRKRKAAKKQKTA